MPKKHLLIALLLALDILLLIDISKNQKLKIKSQILGDSASIVKEEKANVKSSVTVLTISPTLTATPSPSPTPTPSPSPTPAQTQTPEPTPVITDIHVYPYKTTNDLLQQINSFRSSRGLSPLSENSETCSFAALRAGEIVSNFTHEGFRSRIDGKTLPYPSYSSVAENISYNGDSSQVIPNWINSQGHAENLLKDVPFGCVGNSGIHYAFEAWKP